MKWRNAVRAVDEASKPGNAHRKTGRMAFSKLACTSMIGSSIKNLKNKASMTFPDSLRPAGNVPHNNTEEAKFFNVPHTKH
eukprot:1160515-Pelagomonas_calceolata.AAC.5